MFMSEKKVKAIFEEILGNGVSKTLDQLIADVKKLTQSDASKPKLQREIVKLTSLKILQEDEVDKLKIRLEKSEEAHKKWMTDFDNILGKIEDAKEVTVGVGFPQPVQQIVKEETDKKG